MRKPLDKTRLDRKLEWFKNNRVFSALILLFIAIVGLSQLTDALGKFRKFYYGEVIAGNTGDPVVSDSVLMEREYFEGFRSGKSKPLFRLVKLEDYSAFKIKTSLGNSTWEGGEHWGIVEFDSTGRVGYFTNTNDKPAGKILIQADCVYQFCGEWFQGEKGPKDSGICMVYADSDSLTIWWGVVGHTGEKWPRIKK